MQNERDVEFTPSPAMGATAGGVEFTPAPGLGGTSGGEGGQGQVGAAVDQAKATAQRVVGQAQERVQSGLDAQKERAAESLSGVADSLRSTARQVGGQGGLQESVGAYAQQAADRVEDLAAYLRNSDVNDLLQEVENLARRQPALFLGGAFTLGVLGARFLKSSRRNLVHEGVRDRWSTQDMTSRVYEPERDAVGRPGATGYAPPSERAGSDPKAAGPRGG